jgi:CBS domain-containing protein
MFDQPIRSVIQRNKLVKVPPETPVSKAAALMAKKNVGVVLVVESERLVGIFTERDIAFRVVAKGLDAKSTPLVEVMTAAPDTIEPDLPLGQALLRMHERGYRHLPVVEYGRIVGIVSARSAMDPALEEFSSEAQRRMHYGKDG